MEIIYSQSFEHFEKFHREFIILLANRIYCKFNFYINTKITITNNKTSEGKISTIFLFIAVGLFTLWDYAGLHKELKILLCKTMFRVPITGNIFLPKIVEVGALKNLMEP